MFVRRHVFEKKRDKRLIDVGLRPMWAASGLLRLSMQATFA